MITDAYSDPTNPCLQEYQERLSEVYTVETGMVEVVRFKQAQKGAAQFANEVTEAFLKPASTSYRQPPFLHLPKAENVVKNLVRHGREKRLSVSTISSASPTPSNSSQTSQQTTPNQDPQSNATPNPNPAPTQIQEQADAEMLSLPPNPSLDPANNLEEPAELNDSIATMSTVCLLYTSPSPRDLSTSRMPSSA